MAADGRQAVFAGDALAFLKKAGDIALPAQATGTHSRHTYAWTARKATVHARNTVVAGPQKTLLRLQTEQGEQPVVGLGMAGAGGLEVVVLGRDQHIQRVGSVQQVVPSGGVFTRHGRL